MSENTTWIDFKELRTLLRFSEVFAHYNVQLNVKGERATGYCPLPTHQGKRKSPSFSVNLKRGIWQCFGCHAKGNVLDFCSRMEGFDPDNPQELRKAALKIRDIFLGGSIVPKQEQPKKESPRTIINPALDFDLRTLDPDHPYLKERGFREETIRHFGLGYCNRGMLKGRIAIPLHNPQGQLVGYAGRLTKDEDVSDRAPKYLFPGERERDGVTLKFRKSAIVYNACRARQTAAKLDRLVLVEGFASVWWLWQHGIHHAVALLGNDISAEQVSIIRNLLSEDGQLFAFPDGDKAGFLCASRLFLELGQFFAVRYVKLLDGLQPTDCDAAFFQSAFTK